MSTGEFATIGYTINATNVTFQGTSSLDRYGAVHYAWTFGDTASLTGQTVSHTYAVAGAYNVHLTAVIGSTPAFSDVLVQVPASPPTIASITDDVALLTGALSDGQSTNDNDLAVKVSLPTGSGVTAAASGDVLLLNNPWQTLTSYTLTASDITNGYATVQTGFLFDGTYDLTAQIVSDSGAGATSLASNVFEVTVDTDAPDAPVLDFGPGVSDGNGATSSEAGFPGAVTVTGTEPDTTITVTFTNGANVVSKNLAAAGYAQAVALTAGDLATLGDGTITVGAVQTDDAGNTSPQATTSFVLDTNAPASASLSLDLNIQFGGATAAEAEQPSGVVTVQAEAGASVTVKFTNSSNPGNVVTKTLIADGTAQAVVLNAGDLSYLQDGQITVGAFVQDAAGNNAMPSTAFFTLDTLPPVPGSLIVFDRLVDSDDAPGVPWQASGVEVGGSGFITFTDGAGGHSLTVPLTSGLNSGFADLAAFGRNVRSSITVSDAAGNSVTSAGNPAVVTVATSPALVLTIAEYNSISPSEWQGNPAFESVTVKDTRANFAALSGSAIADMATQGVDDLASPSRSLGLNVDQYRSLGSLDVSVPVEIVDTAIHIQGMTTGEFAGMVSKNIQFLQYSDTPLVLSVAQYNNLGGVLLPSDHSTSLEDDHSIISALSPVGLYAASVSMLVSADPVTFLASQAIALGRVTVSAPSVTLSDTAAHIAELSIRQLGALAGSGFTSIDATDNTLTLSAAQFRALGTVALSSADSVTLKDSWANISALDLAALAAKQVDTIEIAGRSFAITATQIVALAGVAFTGEAVGTLVGPGSSLDGFADLLFLPLDNINKIDASDDALQLTVERYQSLGPVQLTAGDTVTLLDTGTNIAALDAIAIAELTAGLVDKIDVAPGDALTLGLDQFNALGRVVLDPDVTLTLNGDVGFAPANDTFAFRRQPFSAADKINGYDGTDTLSLTGDYGTLAFRADTISGVERIKLNGGGHSYTISENDGNLHSGQTLRVMASSFTAADSLSFDGSAETDAKFIFTGGAAGTSTFTGGNGADIFNAGNGADTIRYTAARQSTGTGFDTVNGFDAGLDHFDTGSAVSSVVAFSGGSLSLSGFDTGLAAAAAGQLTVGGALLFTPAGGGFANSVFLVMDSNRSGAYESGGGGDLVVRLTNASNMGSFGTSNFINPPADGGTWT